MRAAILRTDQPSSCPGAQPTVNLKIKWEQQNWSLLLYPRRQFHGFKRLLRSFVRKHNLHFKNITEFVKNMKHNSNKMNKKGHYPECG